MITKEKYWRYTLIVIIIFLGVIIFREFMPFLSGVLGACTMYVLVRRQMIGLTERRKMNKSVAALLILTEVILCFLVPAFFVIWLSIGKIEDIHLDPSALINTIQNFARLFQTKTGYNLLNSDNIATVTTFSTKVAQLILGQISSFVINAIVMLFVLYFMLVSIRSMESYVYDILPFNDKNKKYVLNNIHMIVKSNAIGIPLLAIIQGGIATIGYIIFDVPNPALFGFLTCFATLIPLLGTALIWLPLAAYAALSGDWFSAIGLAAYSIIIVSNADNLIRFMLQKKMADTHPLITVFGVIIGLTLFGFWGVIFGPLLLSMFLLCFNIFKEEYLDGWQKLKGEAD